MKYEVSNIIFKDKPKQIGRKYPFKRLKEQVHLIEDTPQNLFLTYERGFSVKPHPFTEDNLHNAKVNTIILDFDKLTKEQCEFVKSHSQYGDYSAGTKTRLYENRDIPDYENPKWGFKVFYPASCLCVWKELNQAFTEAVKHYNPNHTDEEVESIWEKWRTANNHKGLNGIDNPIFNGWILPDVAMLNSFRTQITYGVKPELKKDYILTESDWEKADGIYSKFAFPSGDKRDYSGLEWKPEDVIKDKDVSDEIAVAWQKVIGEALEIEVLNAIQNPDDLRLSIPTTKSMVARRLKKQTFEDLPWDEKSNAILNARLYARKIDFDQAKQVAMDSARTLTHNLLELEAQRNVTFNNTDALKNNIHAICHDILVVVRQRCGLTILQKKGLDNETKKSISDAMLKTTNNYVRRRARLKLKAMEREWNPPHLGLLRQYTATKDKTILAEYNRQRKEWIDNNIKVANELKIPYTYRKRGLKKWLICTACLDLTMEELEGFGLLEPTRLETMEDWVEWCKNSLASRQDDLNDVSDDDLRRWWKDYQRTFNSKWGSLEQKIDKRTGAKHSKYDDLFKDKTKDEIADLIDSMDISRGRKSQLRNEWL